MNEKEKLTEVTINTLTGKLNETKININDLFNQTWGFHDGEWYKDYYKRNGPMKKVDFINEMMTDGGFNYTDKDMVEVYSMIYDKLTNK